MNPEVDMTFWRDWMLAVAVLKGEVELLPETLKQWEQDVKEAKDEMPCKLCKRNAVDHWRLKGK